MWIGGIHTGTDNTDNPAVTNNVYEHSLSKCVYKEWGKSLYVCVVLKPVSRLASVHFFL